MLSKRQKRVISALDAGIGRKRTGKKDLPSVSCVENFPSKINLLERKILAEKNYAIVGSSPTMTLVCKPDNDAQHCPTRKMVFKPGNEVIVETAYCLGGAT